MKQYDTYKDSGIAWIGEIPSEWEVCRIKNLCFFCPTNNNDIAYEVVGYAPMNTIRNGHIEALEIETGKLTSGLTYFENGDIVMAKVTPCFENGNIAIASNLKNGRAYGSSELFVFRATSVDTSFLYYAIQNEVFKGLCVSTMTGTGGLKRISPTFVVNSFLPTPNRTDQQSIATFLDTKCVEIDALISLQEEMISELQAYKQSVITEAVTKGLNPNAKMKDSGVEWIGEIPESWNVCKAKFLVNISHGMDPVTDGDIPVYGSGADSFKTCGEYKEGDAVLIGRKGATLHIPHYIKGRYWNVDTAFDVKAKDNFNLRYYYYNAICFDYKKYMSQTTLPGMTQSNYNNMKLPCPPLPEQHSITTYLDEKTSQIDSLISLKQQKIEELRDYKKSIIYEYVTGKKRV